MGRTLIVLLSFTLSSCAYYSPYIDPTPKPNDPATAREFSHKKKEQLTDEANALSNANLYATTALAGTLGFGAYKVLSGGSPHQIAALATGSGVIYGYQQALYNETVATILLTGAQTLSCIDSAYTMPGVARGQEAMSQLQVLSPLSWEYIRPAYLAALDKVNASENHYYSNISRVVTATNIQRSTLQNSPRQTYDLLSSSLAATKSVPAPNTQVLTTLSKNAATASSEKDGNRVYTMDVGKQREIYWHLVTIKEWIEDIDAAAANFNPEELEKCRATTKPPNLIGATPGKAQDIKIDETRSFKIENTSGNLNASSSARDSTGARYVETKISTENGNYFLEVTGKVKTTAPVSVFVTDETKDGATAIIQFTVL